MVICQLVFDHFSHLFVQYILIEHLLCTELCLHCCRNAHTLTLMGLRV